jgi:hypothetical protein
MPKQKMKMTPMGSEPRLTANAIPGCLRMLPDSKKQTVVVRTTVGKMSAKAPSIGSGWRTVQHAPVSPPM